MRNLSVMITHRPPLNSDRLPRPARFCAFVAVVAALVCWLSNAGIDADAAVKPRFKAVAFDYFVLFNPDSVVPVVEAIFPGKGRELTTLWRTRQLEYSWLRAITNRYADFFAVNHDALGFAAAAMRLELTAANKRRLLDAYLHLELWPDTRDGLRTLKA